MAKVVEKAVVARVVEVRVVAKVVAVREAVAKAAREGGVPGKLRLGHRRR